MVNHKTETKTNIPTYATTIALTLDTNDRQHLRYVLGAVICNPKLWNIFSYETRSVILRLRDTLI